MAKIHDIKALAEVHAGEISRSPREWMRYLDTASQLYRYSFRDTLLIHAQRPEATACAELELWNSRMNRWVNRGAKGIALLDDSSPRLRLRYVFDVSDTHPVKGARDVVLWKLTEEHHDELLSHLSDAYGLENSDSVSAALMEIARQLTEDNLEEAMEGLSYEVGGSFLEGLDEDSLRVEFRGLLESSIYYTLCKRCGLDPMEELEEEDFIPVTDFNKLSVLSFVGNATSALSEPVLKDIGREMRKIYDRNRSRQLEKSVDSLYNANGEFNTLKRESKSETQNIESEGGHDYGTDLSSQGGLPVSQSGSDGRTGDPGQVRDASQDVFKGEQAKLVSEYAPDREAEHAPVRDREDSRAEIGGTDGEAPDPVPGTGQGEGSAGLGSSHEQPAGDGRGEHLNGVGVHLTADTTEQDLSKAEEEIASALSLPELPTVESQKRAIEERQAAQYAGEISIPTEAVDEIIRTGGNRSSSQLRLIYNFMIDQTPEEYADFVKKEYGVGGKGLVIDGKEYSVWWDELGMQISLGHSVKDKILDKAFLSWQDVSDRIHQLLSQGEYAPKVVLDVARGNALQEHAQALAYMHGDLAEGISELVFADESIFRGGYPDVVERLSGLIANPAFLSDLNERLSALAEVYEADKSLMRFHYYAPDKVATQFQKFAREAIPYQTREDFSWQEHGVFITQDEIDAFLTGGGPYSDGRLATYAYFIADHTDREKADFMKERYGTGGQSHALAGADNTSADYDAKGLVLKRGDLSSPDYSLLLKWPKVALRIQQLIDQNEFLKPADYSRMPDYEREWMMGSVISFYARLPEEITRPFTTSLFNEEARKEIPRLLADPEQAEKLVSAMDEALAAIPLDFDRYKERSEILAMVHQYVEGTFTIFPAKQEEVDFSGVEGQQLSIFDFNWNEPEKETAEVSVEETEEKSAEEETVKETEAEPTYQFESGTFVYLDNHHLFQIDQVDGDVVVVNDMENPSHNQRRISAEQFNQLLAVSSFNNHLLEGNHPQIRDMRSIYKECLYQMLDVIQKSEIYPALRDRDTDTDTAEHEIREKVTEILQLNAKTHPTYLEASQNWPNFTDWMVEDIFQRTYQDVITDTRDAIALHEGDADAPEWIKEAYISVYPQEIKAVSLLAGVEELVEEADLHTEGERAIDRAEARADGFKEEPEVEPAFEIAARFQSTMAMEEGFIEDIAILRDADGKYQIHYSFDEALGNGTGIAGPFENYEDALQTLRAVRPDAVEIGKELEQSKEMQEAGTNLYHPVTADFENAYNTAKNRYPDSFLGFEHDGHYLLFGEDARNASEILGSKILQMPLTSGGAVDVTGFPAGQWVYYSKKLWGKGENVCLYSENEDGSHSQMKYLSGKDYLPIGAELHIDGREFRIDTVDFAYGKVSLQDMTMAREARYPIFREEPIEFVRSIYEQEGPQFDFATEEQVFLAMQRSRYTYEDFSGEQMDVIYAAAQKNLNLRPMINPDFSPEQMQLIADVQDRAKKREQVAFDDVLVPVSSHVMTPEEINAVRREYRLPLEPFTGDGEPVKKEPEELEGLDPSAGSVAGSKESSPEQPSGRPEAAPKQEKVNFRITDDDLGAGGPKAKFRANMDAIHLLKTIEAEGRLATPEEQEVLSRFVGWGGISQAFDPDNTSWSREFSEVKENLTTEEYQEARASTLNAFYTSPTVIKAMYEALENMGLRTGNVLEPSCGIGNFMGLVPESMENLKMYGVELDSISGRIARQLYQKNQIAIQGFETMDFPDSFFDCTIGNVPFGNYKVLDKNYDRHNFMIHDYFIARSLDLVRPGGVVAVVTSAGTMDKQDESVRRYFANRADLLGAIRLPDNAFMRNANTGVVADILFFQKRDRAALEEPEWVHLSETQEGHRVNAYFANHPEMVLGEFSTENTQYGKQEVTVKPIEGADLSAQLKEAISHIQGSITEVELDESELEGVDTSIPADPGIKNFSFANVDGHIYYRENSRMNLVELPAATSERVLGMIELRDLTQKLLSMQMENCSDAELAIAQDQLNRAYDEFTAQYGLISTPANRRAFSQDSSYCLLASLELLDEEGNLKRKADIFTKRTIRRPEAVTSVDTASEALAVSIGEHAKVDIPFMAQLCGKTEDEVTEELAGVIFKNPLSDEWEMSDEYLSGNVREKLSIARQFAENHPEFAINVAYLERVQPKDLEASEIEARLGAPWIKPEHIQQFMVETFHTPWYLAGRTIEVSYSEVNGAWGISGKTRDSGNPMVNATFGTRRANAYRLLEDALNLRDTKIYDTVEDENGNEKRVINKNETMLAQQKQDAIKAAFKDWVFQDMDRREELVATYNQMFNSIRPREYDGSHIRFVGMTPEINLMPHQKNAVAHILYGGNTLLAHCVGAGKTFQMIAAGMESKRMGLAQKCLYVVPNHLTEQWGSDFLRLYPGANILVATKKDFEPANRKKFCSRIATGNYDAIIIGHSQFERIPLSTERQIRMIERQIDDITMAIADAKDKDGARFTVKQMEKTRKTLETKIKKLNDQSRKDDVVTFEQLGVDRLFVDESHNYKNLFLYTKMRNVAGIAQTDAQKSSDMFMKCQYLDEITGSRGVTFATGTPISNSMVELYTIMRYLQYDTLQKMGLGHFDSWAATFGETVTAIELAPEGTGYRAKTRFARFFNLPELISVFKEAADVRTADMLKLPVPEAEYINEVLKPSEVQKEMVESFSERAEKVRGGTVDPRTDNMLKITNDGRKCALDQRLLNEMLPDDTDSKVNHCVDHAFQIWQETAADRSTQLIFCDLSTPKGDGTFNVYDDVREKLVQKGIPKEEIAFIHEAATETKKAELFAKVRSGQVRILLGSTPKLGAGTNIQDRLIALHHLDCPWKPSDLEQQEGRILRQGNQNEKVKIFRYVTEQTFDAYMWQLLENKQKFISQIMTSKSPVRSAEDVDDTALSYAEIKALATGNPYIKEKMDLDIQVSKLKLLKANHTSQIYRLESDIARRYPMEIAATKERVEGLRADLEAVKPILAQEKDKEDAAFTMTVGGKVYTDKKEAGTALIAACAGLKAVNTSGQVGEYHGFQLNASYDAFNQKFMLTIKRQCSYTIEIGKDPLGNLQRITNALAGIEKRLPEAESKLATLKEQLAAAKEEVTKPFPQEEELRTKSERLAELNSLLNMDERGNDGMVALDDTFEGETVDSVASDRPRMVPSYADRVMEAAVDKQEQSADGMKAASAESPQTSGRTETPEKSAAKREKAEAPDKSAVKPEKCSSVLARLHAKQEKQKERDTTHKSVPNKKQTHNL